MCSHEQDCATGLAKLSHLAFFANLKANFANLIFIMVNLKNCAFFAVQIFCYCRLHFCYVKFWDIGRLIYYTY